MSCCVVCLEQEGTLIKTTCCKKEVHQQCLDTWLNTALSQGTCMHCRFQLRARPVSPEMVGRGFEPEVETIFGDIYASWTEPRGYIYVDIHDSPDIPPHIEAESEYPGMGVPIIHAIQSSDIENTPESLYNGSHVCIIFEDGQFVDALNVPIGWMVVVNGVHTVLQLSRFLRADLTAQAEEAFFVAS